MSRSGATAHSTGRCPCHSSRRTEPSTLIQDKGVLYLTIKKPAKAIKPTKTIDIKTGAAPQTGTAPRKAA